MTRSRKNEIVIGRSESPKRRYETSQPRHEHSSRALPARTGSSIASAGVDYAAEIRALCVESGSIGTAYTIAAQTAAQSVEKVIVAESYLRDAAISLGQEQELTHLISELHQVVEALHVCGRGRDTASVPRSAHIESMKPALPQWWFALSEMLQTTEREIDFLSSIGRGQSRHTGARQLCNLTIRVLRKHYQQMLSEAEDWMSMSNV